MNRTYLRPFILITSLFFLWAFLHNINPILIPHLKKACELSDTQSSYIDVAVSFAYFLIALPAGIFMHRFGYKNGILFGLFLYGAGALLFIPAASERAYLLFLLALFLSASGATFLETVANPYITKLGEPDTATRRLNFAQSFNGVGAVVAPLIGGQFILSGVEHSTQEVAAMKQDGTWAAYLTQEAATVKLPYLVIGLFVILLLVAFYFTRLPDIREKDGAAASGTLSLKVLRHRSLKWAVVAQFFYVGAQTCVGSYFIRFSRFVNNVSEKEAAFLWGSVAMVGFMAGRFIGVFLMKYIQPAKLLALYAAINVLLVLTALFTHGNTAVYALAAVPFFMSIMFPTIFALGIQGLGEEAKFGSSFLVMAIIGGAVFPFLMGRVSDATHSIQSAYIVPAVCFAVVLLFAVRNFRVRSAVTAAAH